MDLEGMEELIRIVPQTYGEAIKFYPWLVCRYHEWDNRTTIENATYLICQLTVRIINPSLDCYERTIAKGTP